VKSRITRLGVMTGAIGVLSLSLTLSANPPAEKPNPPEVKPKTAEPKSPDEKVAVAEARKQARLMHQIYASTLGVMHHHYFRREGAVLPARAMEDVFEKLEDQTKIKARWIAVNTPPMSINHKPETAFELKAAEEIAAGNSEYERVENGEYKRAGGIPLGVGCVGCHTKVFQTAAKTPRFAGLVISIPVKDK
jgi:hypothetical protein